LVSEQAAKLIRLLSRQAELFYVELKKGMEYAMRAGHVLGAARSF
jgi:hypothetical protein